MIAAYERKIAALENRKLVMAERIETSARLRHAFGDLFERAMGFLASPWNIWASGDFAMRRLVLTPGLAERMP